MSKPEYKYFEWISKQKEYMSGKFSETIKPYDVGVIGSGDGLTSSIFIYKPDGTYDANDYVETTVLYHLTQADFKRIKTWSDFKMFILRKIKELNLVNS